MYESTGCGTRFSTSYEYTVRYGWLGMALDKMLLRPLMRWGTQWSFDRLRLWLERGQEPELSLRLWLMKTTARVLSGLTWIYEGLLPKLLFVSPGELRLVEDFRFLVFSPTFSLTLLGIMEVFLGLWLISGFKERIGTIIALLGLILLPMLVVWVRPEALVDPFGGISKNLGLIGCAVVSRALSNDTPSGFR